MMDETQVNNKIFTVFEKRDDFVALQDKILLARPYSDIELDSQDYSSILTQISNIFDEYLEQAYLLDSHLETLLSPVVDQLKIAVKEAQLNVDDPKRGEYAGRLSSLLYLYIKFRGYKTIIRFFPHEIADLGVALGFLVLSDGPASLPHRWSLRYVMLLWLSLICMLPFDLEQFDEHEDRGQTAFQIETVAKIYLNKAGIERDAAAILLSRLYTRKDMAVRFPSLIDWCMEVIDASDDIFSVMGGLRVLCEITKVGAPELVQEHLSALLSVVTSVSEQKRLTSNTVVRKLKTKLVSRIVLRSLPTTVNRPVRRARDLFSAMNKNQEQNIFEDDVDVDVPEETERVLEELFQGLQDKDTIVRYSAAKGVARIAERLPSDFREQILDTVLQLYTIHSIALARMYDLPTIAEATWHGASLACAELARRGLIVDRKLSDVLDWQGKALYFDIRQGAHSIGSSVRDAASYVIWSLAKAQSVDALAPYMVDLSQKLVTVSIYDREVHIRRAASAAFQECVGRTNMCPHGISVLGKTDFYSVGLKRNAFLVAAPEVAEYEEYRSILIEHAIGVTIRHWDPVMRQLGAQSLAEICRLDVPALVPGIASRLSVYLTFSDSSDVHGALLTLTELAAICRGTLQYPQLRKQIFSYLDRIPSAMLLSPRQELVTTEACNLIAASIALENIEEHSDNALPQWRKIIEFGLKSKGVLVQEAAARAITLIREAKQSAAQQALCRMLGLLDYNRHTHGLLEVIQFLLSSVDRESSTAFQDVEARRNAYTSLAQILGNVAPRLTDHLSCTIVCEMIDSLQGGLQDYTTDDRGDVGSWIRIACIRGLADVVVTLINHGGRIQPLVEYLPPSKFHSVVGGILKQGIERLDNVRQHAGQQLRRILELQTPAFPGKENWSVHGEALIRQLFSSDEQGGGWHEGVWLFPRIIRLLEIEQYRTYLISGLVLSVSSRTDSTQRPISTSLVDYVKSLPPRGNQSSRYSVLQLTEDLLAQCTRDLTSNSIVIPVLQTFNVLLEGDTLECLQEGSSGYESLQTLFSIASRNISKVKNVQRIFASMRILINMLPMRCLQLQCIQKLSDFLGHRYPKIRADAAEHLYLILQTKDIGYETDEAEEIILETEWSSEDTAAIQDATQRCVQLLSAGIAE